MLLNHRDLSFLQQLQALQVGGWVELARQTLGADSATIDVSSLDDKKYYMVLSSYNIASGNGNPYFRLNADTGSNYSTRYQMNGATDSTYVSNNRGMYGAVAGYNLLPYFTVDYLGNISTEEKLHIGLVAHQGTAGASNAPNRAIRHLKHAQTSNPITSYNLWNQGGSDIASGGEAVVLGYDPNDTHSTNFYELLAEQEVSNGAFAVDFDAKKYLRIQWTNYNATGNMLPRFNDDSGNNYHRRFSHDGASDSTQQRSEMNLRDLETIGLFCDMFILNISAQEKLVIQTVIDANTSGSANVVNRTQAVWKWANTASQITRYDDDGSGGYDGHIKVWGGN